MLTAFASVASPGTADDTLAPFDWYRDLMVASAKEREFSDHYIGAHAALTAVADADAGRARRHPHVLRR